jgi:hypothetical protein
MITSKRIQKESPLGLVLNKAPTTMRPSTEAMKGRAGVIRKNLLLRSTALTTSSCCRPLNSQCLFLPLPTLRARQYPPCSRLGVKGSFCACWAWGALLLKSSPRLVCLRKSKTYLPNLAVIKPSIRAITAIMTITTMELPTAVGEGVVTPIDSV